MITRAGAFADTARRAWLCRPAHSPMYRVPSPAAYSSHGFLCGYVEHGMAVQDGDRDLKSCDLTIETQCYELR